MMMYLLYSIKNAPNVFKSSVLNFNIKSIIAIPTKAADMIFNELGKVLYILKQDNIEVMI